MYEMCILEVCDILRLASLTVYDDWKIQKLKLDQSNDRQKLVENYKSLKQVNQMSSEG